MRERGARGEVGKEGNGRAGGSAERVRQRFQRDSGADGPQQVAGEAQVQDFGEEVPAFGRGHLRPTAPPPSPLHRGRQKRVLR